MKVLTTPATIKASSFNYDASFIGTKWGRLTVTRLAGRPASRNIIVECRCDCGRTKTVRAAHLTHGKICSCGCLRREKNTKHGLHQSAIYNVWNAMIDRCRNPKHKRYSDWGGRGISVCQEWSDIAIFLKDMGEPPDGCQIDRINNDGNYEPGNCRWTTAKKNCRNRRSVRLLTYNSETMCVTEWAERLGVNRGTIYDRLRRNWSVIRTLETPFK